MDPGRLRHRVVIQAQNTTATSDFGHGYANWTTAATVWASIEPLSGRELFQAKQVQPDATHKIMIRGGQTITPLNRLSHEGRYFNVLSVTNELERNFYKTLIVQESL